MGVVDHILTKAFRKLGSFVAKYPKYFIISSLVISLTLGTGLLRMTYNTNIEYLFSDTSGDNVYEKAIFEKYFPANYSGAFSPSRITELGRLARIIVTSQDDQTVLRDTVWKEIMELDALVHSVYTKYDGEKLNYSQICARPHPGECWENHFIDLGQVMEQIQNGSLRLSYPLMVNPETYYTHILPLHFAGVILSPNNITLVSAEATSLTYFVNFETPEDAKRGNAWEESLITSLTAAELKWKYIKLYYMTHFSLVREQEANTFAVMPYFSATIFLMCTFTVLSALSRDWVKAKPIAALCGIIAANLGCLAGFGFLSYIGVDLIGINLSIPFIMLGIGIDDMFVILATWRQTNVQDPVPKRLADTYAGAGVSITVTSLTDMLSFFVGVLTPIPSVQIFCAYAGTSVFFIYLAQIFFFGAVLAISGDQEAGNRHALFWWRKAVPKSKSAGKSKLFRLFFTGGIDQTDPENVRNYSENATMVFFRDTFSRVLFKKWIQALVLTGFAAFLGVSVWGLLQLDEGLREERLYHDSSYVVNFHLKNNQYFSKYRYRMQIAIVTPLDYSKPAVQQRVAEVLETLQNSSRFLTADYVENWLTGFTSYVERYSELFEFNITTESQFIKTLREEYLVNNIYEKDVVFNEDGTRIIASRFIIQCIDTRVANNVTELVVKLRNAAKSITDMEVVIHNPWLSFVDQFILLRPLTIQLLSIAAAIVMVVAIIFIPNVFTSICVFLSIVSTEVGVIGFMCLWGVSLDMISILCLVMCIGFSVDFSAHICYAYISGTGSSEDRIRQAMYSLGLPIVQGSASTVIGVFSLLFISSYIFQVFFKVVFLVIVCAAWHGLFVLPVLLLIIKPERFSFKCFPNRTGSMDFNLKNASKTKSSDPVVYN